MTTRGVERERTAFSVHIQANLKRLLGERDGVAAVELAILAPLLLAGFIGSYGISVGMSVFNKVGRASASISDVVTQMNSVTPTFLADMPSVAANIFAPYESNGLTVEIVGVQVDEAGKATIAWSYPDGSQTKGEPFSLPAEMTKTKTFYVQTTLTMQYKLPLVPSDYAWSAPTLSRTSMSRIRTGDSISCAGCK